MVKGARWLFSLVMMGGTFTADAEEDPRYTTGPTGPFRIAFDPGNRATLGIGWSPAGTFVDVGLSWRGPSKWREEPDASAAWLRDVQVLSGKVGTATTPEGLPTLDLTLVSTSFVSYAPEPYLTLPGGSGRRVPFPVNIGFVAYAGHLDNFADTSPTLTLVNAALAVDFLHSGRSDRYLRLSQGITYEISLTPGFELDPTTTFLAPFTVPTLAGHLESPDGLWLLEGSATAAAGWGPTSGWSWHTSLHTRVERTLVALQDQPITPWLGLQIKDEGTREVLPMIGVSFGYNLDTHGQRVQ